METKWRLLEFLIARRREGKRIAGYGAPGKGNTLLNYCGIRTDLLEFTVDRNPYKQGQFLPGHAHPDPPSGRARAGAARLHPDPALEPEGRDRGPARIRARVGRAVRRPDPGGGSAVKVVIFCGGQGLRMREASEVVPKPMIPVGNRAGPLARHEVLRALRVHRLRAVPGLQGRGHQALLPDLQRGDGERLRAVRRRRERPPPEDRHPQLEHHLRRHRAARVDRASGCARCASCSRDDELFLANYGDTLTDARPAGHDRARQVDGRDGELPRGHAELQLPRRLGAGRRASWATSAT